VLVVAIIISTNGGPIAEATAEATPEATAEATPEATAEATPEATAEATAETFTDTKIFSDTNSMTKESS